MARSPFRLFRTILRTTRHALVYESRAGRAAEIAGWSNALAAFASGALSYHLTRSWGIALAVAIAAFVVFRLCLAHAKAVWIPAVFGTLAVAALGGTLAWTFAHVVERPDAPPIAAVVVALLSSVLPARAYAEIAKRRADQVPDSLIEPI